MGGWMDGMDGWMDGMDGWMGWMDGGSGTAAAVQVFGFGCWEGIGNGGFHISKH